jgi:hypothetical protein
MRTTRLCILALILIVLPSSGCYKSAGVKEVTQDDIKSLAPGEALIFGRVKMIDNGRERKDYLSFTDQLDVMLVRVEDGQPLSVKRVRADGTFLWRVPRGTYLLTRLRWWELRGWFPLRPRIAFQVGTGAGAYYLGTLRIDAEIERSALSVKLKQFSVGVADEYDRDAQLLTKQLPDFHAPVETALMVHDSRIPAITESEVKQSTVIDVLRSLGFGLMTIH